MCDSSVLLCMKGIVLLYGSGIVVYYSIAAMYCTVDQCVRSNKGRRGKGLFGNEEEVTTVVGQVVLK